MKILKITLALALVFTTVLCFFGCDSGGTGEAESVTNYYFVEFHYYSYDSNEYKIVSVSCEPGDTVTATAPPETMGITYLDYQNEINPSLTVAPGEQFTVTYDMFRNSGGGGGSDGMWEEFTATFTLDWEYTLSSIDVHSFDNTVLGNVEWTLESSAYAYRSVADVLLEGEEVQMGRLPNADEFKSLESVYHNGYRFDGFYCDEDFTVPFTSSTEFTTEITDVFAKWTYVGLFFAPTDYSGRNESAYLFRLDVDEDVDSFEIPAVVNYMPVTEIHIKNADLGTVVCGDGVIGTLTVPSSVTEIWAEFISRANVNELVILSNDLTINERAFRGAPSVITLSSDNEKYAFSDGILYDLTEKTVHTVLNMQSSITVPDGIASIGTVFAGTGIESITLPSSVETLDEGAFEGCTSLSQITLGGVTSIGNSVFEGCTALAQISLGGVTSIGNSAFEGCTSLSQITLSDVTTVGNGAFNGCTALSKITLGRVKTIGDEVFNGCTSLNKIILPSTLTSLSENTFNGCELESIYFEDDESDWNRLNATVSANVYFYSKYEQTITNYLYSKKQLWYYDENGEVVFWINVKNNFAEKTLVASGIDVVSSQWLWTMLSAAKEQGLLDSIGNESMKNAIATATTKDEFDANLTAMTTYSDCKAVFGDNGTVTIYNDLAPDGYVFNYTEINDRLLLEDPLGSATSQGEFYVDGNGALYEVRQGEKLNGNETMTMTFYYSELQ